jgi:adenylate cyclase class 2
MSLETEKKYSLTQAQKEAVADLLREFGAEFKGEDFEENTIYSGGILNEKGAILRIRKTQDKTFLTYKQRIHNEFSVKQQIEHETEVADAGELEKIVENLGFSPHLVYEKRRKIWNFRQVEVVLDELPFGEFMEIEGSVTAIAEAEMFLEAEDFEVVHETYPSLTVRYGRKNGNLFEARFTNPEGKL